MPFDIGTLPLNRPTLSVQCCQIVATLQRLRPRYHPHVNCYIAKPLDLEQFIMVMRSVEVFWFTIVGVPAHAEAHHG